MPLLNLASKPARNETLPSVGFYLALVAMTAVTAKHALVVRSLLPARTSARREEVLALESEAASIQKEAAELSGPPPSKSVVERWTAIRDLVDRRTFSWTRLLARLEKVLPEGVRITAISPRLEKGAMRLSLTAEARSQEQGLELLKRLQSAAAFREVMPESENPRSGVSEYHYTMRYDPSVPEEAAQAGVAAPATGPEESGDGDATAEEEPQ